MKEWMNDRILSMIEERRKVINKDPIMYRAKT